MSSPYNNAGINADNWMSALIGVRIVTNVGSYEFTNYARLTVNKNHSYRVMDSIGNHNIGYNKLPTRVTFSIIVPDNSNDANMLRGLLASEKIFQLEYFDLNRSNDANETLAGEYKLNKERLVNAILETSADSYQTEGVPMLTFTGKALGYQFAGQCNSDDYDTLYGTVFGDNKEFITDGDMSTIVDANIWPGT